MKIAIMFFGQLRWFDNSHVSFKKNFLPSLNNHQVQYFAHFQDHIINQENVKKFENLYEPLTLIAEQQKSIDEMHLAFNMKERMHLSLLAQTYSFYQSFLLMEEYQNKNNMKFDIYIKIRSDLIYLDKVDLNKFDLNSLYTKGISHWRPYSNYIHDYILCTRSFDTIKVLAELGYGLDEVISKKDELLYGVGVDTELYCCEEILARHLVNKNIQIKNYNFNVDLARNHL